MWVALEKQGAFQIFEIFDRATFGSAKANDFQSKDPQDPALLFQFFSQKGQFYLRDFLSSTEQAVQENFEIQVSAYRVFVGGLPMVWEICKSWLWGELQSYIHAHSNISSRKFIDWISQKSFFGRPLPSLFERNLTKKISEYLLKGPVERLLGNKEVTDILIHSFDEIWIEKQGVLQRSEEKFTDEKSYRIYIENLLVRHKVTLNEENPFASFTDSSGTRTHIVGSPVASRHFYVSIRKPRQAFFQLNDLVQEVSIQRTLKEGLKRGLNILVSGATGSGKTTLIKSLLSELPVQERILVVEDHPELRVDRANCVYLQTHELGSNRISLRDLIREALRMRPDRIILGEARGEEAFDLLQAMNTGHRGCMGSVHANSARDALKRILDLARLSSQNISELSIRSLIASNIDLVVHLNREKGGHRSISEVAQLVGLEGSEFVLEKCH